MTTSSIPAPVAETQVHIGAGMVVPLTEAVRRLRCLPALDRNVLALRLGLIGRPRSRAQTASLLHITPERERAVEALASARLQHPSPGWQDGDATQARS